MDEIARILARGKSDRVAAVAIPNAQEIAAAESALNFAFPASYRQFLHLGGIAERRINHTVLSPLQIRQAMKFLPDATHIPFADNHCGDLYCWPQTKESEPEVLFFDHETNEYSRDCGSFTEWLEKNKF